MALIAEGNDCWDVERSSTGAHLTSHFGTALTSLPSHVDMEKAISRQLTKLQLETQATACILFHMSLEGRVVRVMANTGTPLNAYDTKKYTLQASPIQEVIRQGIEVFEEDTSRNPEKFKYLNLIDYASCIGLPVETIRRTRYSLFLFHSEKGHFTREHLRQAKMTSYFIGSIVDRGEVENVVRKVQPLVFAGQIGATLIHEINNRLGSVMNSAETLLVDHNTIEKDVDKAMDSKLRKRISESIRNLESDVRGMEKITSLYLGLMSIENREVVRINETVQRALNVLAPMAARNQVEILTEFENDLPATIAVGSWLEQAFVNVILNAIQHISLSKGEDELGELVVQTRFADHDDTFSLQVLFIDDGPGIHAQQLEHIFSMGFSTRTDGTGLGLFTSRGLIEALGGTIRVEASVMFVGTTFLIELPLIVPSVEEVAHG
jgi:signal transduction histidine kinase